MGKNSMDQTAALRIEFEAPPPGADNSGVIPMNADTACDNGAVDHPAHYKAGGLEAIDVIEALGHGHGFCVGNALKYLWRAGKKTPDALEDLRKARWYVDRAITALEKGGG